MEFNLCIIESVMGKYGIGYTETYWKSFKSENERKEYIKILEQRYDYINIERQEVNNNVNAMYVVAEKEEK